MNTKPAPAPPPCPYCGYPSELAPGTAIYPHRPDLEAKKFFLCVPCWAYVGCHEKTGEPFGRLADSQLRKEKMKAHAAFDPLWKSKRITRHEAYRRLSIAMKIPPAETHIGMFDVVQCRIVVALCAAGVLEAKP